MSNGCKSSDLECTQPKIRSTTKALKLGKPSVGQGPSHNHEPRESYWQRHAVQEIVPEAACPGLNFRLIQGYYLNFVVVYWGWERLKVAGITLCVGRLRFMADSGRGYRSRSSSVLSRGETSGRKDSID